MDMVVGKFRGRKDPRNELKAQPLFDESLYRAQSHHFHGERAIRAPEVQGDDPAQKKAGDE
jgi:hypothetical protein